MAYQLPKSEQYGKNLFGGDFTPFRDIWNSIAGDLGITTKRMGMDQQTILGKEAEQLRGMNESFDQLTQAIAPFAQSDIDKAQLATVVQQQRMLTQLAQHPDPAVREQALQHMTDIKAGTNAWLDDIETQQEAAAKEQRELVSKRRDEVFNEVKANYKTMRNIDAEYNKLIGLGNAVGYDDPATQGAFRDFLGLSFGDVKEDQGALGHLSVHVPGLGGVGFGLGDNAKSYTKDQIIAAATAARNAQYQTLDNVNKNLNAQAEKDGYRINIQDGEVHLEDLNTDEFKPMLLGPNKTPTNPTPTPPPRTLGGDVGGAIDALGKYLTGQEGAGANIAGAGAAAAAAGAVGNVIKGIPHVEGHGVFSKALNALIKAPKYALKGALRGGAQGLALDALYQLNKNPPPKFEGETDEQYAERLSAMMAGEGVDSMSAPPKRRRPTNE